MFIVVERWITRTVLGLIIAAILAAAFIWGSGGNDQVPGPSAEDAHWTTTSASNDVARPAGTSADGSSASSDAGDEQTSASTAGAGVDGQQTSVAAAGAMIGEEAVPAGATGSFFARYRLDRARTRSQQMELYTRMLSDTGLGTETREQAQKELMVLAAQEEKETAVENLLRARGYDEALVILDQRGATVVIPDQVMTKEKAAQIGELVRRITGVPLDSISILPVGV